MKKVADGPKDVYSCLEVVSIPRFSVNNVSTKNRSLFKHRAVDSAHAC